MVAAYWYDKKSRDERFKMLELRMAEAEVMAHEQKTELRVMSTELKAFSKLTDAHLNHIKDSIDRIFVMLERNSNEQKINRE